MGSDVVPRHKYRKARIVTQTSKFQPILAGLVESPASARMAQTGTPPPIRIARPGFRGPCKYEKIPKSGNRTQTGAQSSWLVFPGSASYPSFALLLRQRGVVKVGSKIVRERELPTANLPGSMKEGC